MTIARLGGVPVRLHWSFLVLVAGWLGWVASRAGLMAVGPALLGIVALFGSVLAHELGHAMVARRFGIRTHEITLLPIGGAARMELRFVEPMADVAVSLAGPAVSVGLGGVCLAAGFGLNLAPMVLLGAINLVLGIFNLIPAFPMDGGRVLRALLTMRVGAARANDWTLAIGAVFALVFVLGGLAMREPGLWVLGLLLVMMQVRERRIVRSLRARVEA